MIARFLSASIGLAVMTDPSVAEVTYSELTEQGRPSQFYEYATAATSKNGEACKAVLAELNKPLPLKSYDLKAILLANSLAIEWRKEVVSRERHSLPGEVRTAEISLPGMQAPIELLQRTLDVRDAPVDFLVMLRQSTIQSLRLADGKLDAAALLSLLRSADEHGKRLVPPPEWVREHNAHGNGNDSTPFADDYYWSEAIVVRNKLYVLMVSPPQFDYREQLRGVLDIFMAAVTDGGLSPLECHFVHEASGF